MAGRGRGGLLLVLAGLAILFGTAAMVLSRGPVRRRISPVERVVTLPSPDAARPVVPPAPPPRRPPGSEGRTALAVRVLRLPEREVVPGAEVLLQDEGGVWKAVADRNGEAVFEVEARRPVILRAKAPGLVGLPRFALPSTVEAPPEEVLLAVEGGLHGVVRSKATKEPIAGARVAVATQFPGPPPSWPALPEPAPELAAPSAETTTGPDGRFSLSGLPEGFGCNLTASHPGFADGTMGGLCPNGEGKGPDLEVLLAPGGRILGTVRDRAGNPVAGVSVFADRSPVGVPGGPPWLPKRVVLAGALPPPRPVFRANSDPDGSFALEGVASGRTWYLGAWLEGFTTVGGPAKVDWPPDAPEVRCDLVLDRVGEIVVDWTAADRPVPAVATVSMEKIEETKEGWNRPGLRRGGRFKDLPPGRYRVRVLAEQVGQGEEEVEVPGGGTIEVSIPLVLGDGIDGVVVDARGTPVVGAMVTLETLASTLEKGKAGDAASTRVAYRGMQFEAPYDLGGNPRPSYPGPWPVHLLPGGRWEVLTDAEGRFRILGLVAGDAWRLRAERDGFAPVRTDPVEVPASGIRLELIASGAVVGRLVLPPGEDARSGVSFYYRSDAEAAGRAPSPPDSLRSRTSFGTGAFRVEHLPPGPGRLLVLCDDRGPTATIAVDIPAGGTADAGELRLGGGFLLRGQVVDAAGRPVQGARVDFRATGVRDRTETTSAGTFVIEHLPECEGEIEVRPAGPPTAAIRIGPGGHATGRVSETHPPNMDWAITTLHVAVGPGTPPVEIALPATGVLDGIAKDATGAPYAGFRITTIPRDRALEMAVAHLYCDANGRFSARLPVGEYHIVIHSRTPPWAPLVEADAVVPADGEVSVELRAKE